MLYCPNFFWNVLQVWMTGKDVYLQMTWSWPDKTWNILCSYCLQWNTSQSKFRNHYFLFLFAFSILSQLFLIWGCIYVYTYIRIYIYIYFFFFYFFFLAPPDLSQMSPMFRRIRFFFFFFVFLVFVVVLFHFLLQLFWFCCVVVLCCVLFFCFLLFCFIFFCSCFDFVLFRFFFSKNAKRFLKVRVCL